MQSQNDRMISVHFQGNSFNITVIKVYASTSNAEEAEVKWFCEDLQDLHQKVTRLQQYVNCELPDVQSGFRKGRGTRDQVTNISWIIKKAREFQKNIYFGFIDHI